MGAGDIAGAPDGARGCVAAAFAGLAAPEEADSGPLASVHTAGYARAVDGARAMRGGLTTIVCGQKAKNSILIFAKIFVCFGSACSMRF
jgi:hypothetical protein